MIVLKNIWKSYQIDEEIRFDALKNVSLSIKEKEFVSIIGPSGSGKSTLMHIIGLLDKPSKGKIWIKNKEVSQLTDDQTSKLRNRFVGFVFQQFNLINKLTVLENILLPAIYSRERLNFDPEKRALELMKKFNIADKENSYPNKLSGGEQQRVAIARALIINPDLILADEPTGNLDTKNGQIILELLEKLNQVNKKTVVIVSHNPSIAKRANRVISIKDGQIVSG